MNKIVLRAALATLGGSMMIAAAPGHAFTPADAIGESAMVPQADRTIVVTPSTRFVNVRYGESVKFDVQGQGADQVVWRFNGVAHNVTLKDIGVKGNMDIPIYIDQSENPLYQHDDGE